MKQTIVKLPNQLFRVLYSTMNGYPTCNRVSVKKRGQKPFDGLRLNDGIETYLIIPKQTKETK